MEFIRRGLEHEPCREEFYWHLVQAHMAMRNRREALAACHRYEEMMKRELDLPPSARMRELAGRVVALG